MLRNRLVLLGYFILSLSATSASAEEENLSGLLVRFEEPAGRRFTDYSGSGHTITPVGTVTRSYSNKVNGGSVCFDGDGHLEVSASTDFAFSGDLTIDFWFKTAYAGRQHGLSIGQTSTDTSTDGDNIDFDFADDDIASDGNPVGFWLYWNGSGAKKITSGTRFQYTDDQWHHVAMVRSNGVITAYMDGVSVGTASYSGPLGSATKPLLVGAQLSNGVIYHQWRGCIDDLRIINGRALWTSNFKPGRYLLPPLNAYR